MRMRSLLLAQRYGAPTLSEQRYLTSLKVIQTIRSEILFVFNSRCIIFIFFLHSVVSLAVDFVYRYQQLAESFDEPEVGQSQHSWGIYFGMMSGNRYFIVCASMLMEKIHCKTQAPRNALYWHDKWLGDRRKKYEISLLSWGGS